MKNNSQFKNQESKFHDGFTLIELLIVIAIIGVLTSLLSVNFIAARQRGRDAQRKSDIRQIQSALELYRSDQSRYPDPPLNCGGQLLDPGGTVVYMKSIPCDPSGGSYQYSSQPAAAATQYTLVACLENGNDGDIKQRTSPGNGITCANTNYFIVTNP